VTQQLPKADDKQGTICKPQNRAKFNQLFTTNNLNSSVCAVKVDKFNVKIMGNTLSL